MKVKTSIIFAPIVLAFILIYPSNTSVLAEPSEDITVIPIDDKISLEKTTSTMHIPDNKSLSWGAVKGKASDYVERYPVIIQFFKEDQPVHVAQVKVKGDGSYEYKFKIRNTDKNTGEIIDIFEGKYTVKIFKVIPNRHTTDI